MNCPHSQVRIKAIRFKKSSLLCPCGELLFLLLMVWPSVGSWFTFSCARRCNYERENKSGSGSGIQSMEAGKVARLGAWEKDTGGCELQRPQSWRWPGSGPGPAMYMVDTDLTSRLPMIRNRLLAVIKICAYQLLFMWKDNCMARALCPQWLLFSRGHAQNLIGLHSFLVWHHWGD